MDNEVVVENVMVDCDDEKKLQKFYGELLGWEMVEKAESLGATKSNVRFGGKDFDFKAVT